MAVGVNIYPPVLDTYMPAYLKGGEVIDGVEGYKFYLSLSDYNTFEDVEKNVQVTLVRQDTNKTAFLTTKASSGIFVTELKKEIDDDDNVKYYIVIEKNSLITEELLTNLFYKVQIRFTSSTDENHEAIPQEDNPVEASWYTKYLNCFSEWSTVCLIKGIETPVITLTGLKGGNAVNTIGSPTLDVYGGFSYLANSKNERETLKSYRLLLYKNDTGELVEDSGEILTNQNNMPNNIKYTFNAFLESADSVNYVLKLIYTTNNLYTNEKNPLVYNLKVQYDTEENPFILTTVTDDEEGFIQVKIRNASGDPFAAPVIVRRADSTTNFSKWETVHNFSLSSSKHIFNDMTIETGVFYKYYAYYDNNTYSTPSRITEPKMITLDYVLLTTADRQLKLYLDGKISSVSYNVSESKTDTIGGRYPVIRKNGNMMYRTIPLEGTIHSYMDGEGKFETKDSIYGENKVLYSNYNLEHDVKPMQDHVYEKMFRDKVKEFFFTDQAILLRTPSEGNLIVKLMNTGFSPNSQLNNLVYKFSNQAIEIDECTIEKLKNYKLIKENGEDIEIFKKDTSKSSVLSGTVTDEIYDSIIREAPSI